jgi:hypothetical protein
MAESVTSLLKNSRSRASWMASFAFAPGRKRFSAGAPVPDNSLEVHGLARFVDAALGEEKGLHRVRRSIFLLIEFHIYTCQIDVAATVSEFDDVRVGTRLDCDPLGILAGGQAGDAILVRLCLPHGLILLGQKL